MVDYRISINVLNYNTFEKTKKCIDSCLQQTGGDFRVLLIDNKSTDDSFQKLQEHYGEQIEYLQTGDNYGYAKGNNIGVKYSREHGFQYSFLLNSDTELKGNKLIHSLLNLFEQYDDCGIAAPLIYDVTSKGLKENINNSFYLKLLRLLNVLPRNHVLNGIIEQKSEAHGSALLVDNERFLSIGGFPEHYFMYSEESLFSKKILWSGYRIYWLNDKLNYVYHHHDTSNHIEPWRLYLMGRNASLEYLENRGGHKQTWIIAFLIFIIRSFIWMITKPSYKYHFIGMMDGIRLVYKGYSQMQCFEHGKRARTMIR